MVPSSNHESFDGESSTRKNTKFKADLWLVTASPENQTRSGVVKNGILLARGKRSGAEASIAFAGLAAVLRRTLDVKMSFLRCELALEIGI